MKKIIIGGRRVGERKWLKWPFWNRSVVIKGHRKCRPAILHNTILKVECWSAAS